VSHLPAETAGTTPLVEARKLSAGYGGLAVIRDIDLCVMPGEVVALLGPNGAGKTTTLRALMGATRVQSGDVYWQGEPMTLPMDRRAGAGMSYVPEDRAVINSLSASDNLRLGGGDIAESIALFPELEPLLDRRGGLLSGGEMQMVALARALTRKPSFALFADELSFGLAPVIVNRLLDAVRAAADDGRGVLLVEQHAEKALSVADRAYVLVNGRIEIASDANELLRDAARLEQQYLGGLTREDSRARTGSFNSASVRTEPH